MSETTHPPERLVAASEHLLYEVWMFESTSKALMAGECADDLTKNAFLESFTVYTRALLQFFYGAKRFHKADVLAEHFFADRERWVQLRDHDKKPKALEFVEGRVGTEIAHISYARLNVGPEAWHWDVPSIREAMLSLIERFVDNVPGQLLSPQWRQPAPDAPVAADRSRPASGAKPLGVYTTTSDVSSTGANSFFKR